ncbi:MAG: hypothetical protein O9331_16160 [Acidovorax sp.]|uniref:hypothetical protein n=1 Tax=Limnobacter sp. TaxID=2003368 RepID=UPI0022C18DA6|nr:hypothetical protein [Limnobacter sp.]MCZ8017187.1 hypothetical protein [Limnobacter sp.]MCZ8074464.1 hypothetical protein [Roseateles sp.]MCZ8095012.1 hypothetical protein [Acidovorax sp.]MCZ8227688.1 hypothetical protein [Burkholderiaceae bacterium]
MTHSPAKIAAGVAGFALLYIAMYFLSDLFIDNQSVFGLASLVFLPAFVRLLGFMILRLWIMPALFIATGLLVASGAYDVAPGYETELIIGAFTAVGGPLGAYLTSRLIGLEITLNNLTPMRLLWMSVGCSLGNAVFYRLSLELSGIHLYSTPIGTTIFIGDVVGTWVIIYILKGALTSLGRRL